MTVLQKVSRAAKQPIEIAHIKTFFSSQVVDIAHCRGFSYCVPDTGGWRSSAQEPIPVSRDINGDDALGVDVLVRIGSDVHDVMIRVNLRRSRSNLTDPGRVRLLLAYVSKQYPFAENIISTVGPLESTRVGVRNGADALITEIDRLASTTAPT